MPIALVAMVLYALLVSTAVWLRPGINPTATAQPVAVDKGGLHKFWKWVSPFAWGEALAHASLKLVGGTLRDLVSSVEHWVQSAISHALATQLRPLTRWLHTQAVAVRDTSQALSELAYRAHQALAHLRDVTVPFLIEEAVAPARAAAAQARALAADAEGRLDVFRDALGDALAASRVGAWTTLAQMANGIVDYMQALHDKVWLDVVPKVEQAVAVTIPGIASDLQDLIGDLYNTGIDSLDSIRARLRNLEDQAIALAGGLPGQLAALLASVAFVDAVVLAITARLPFLGCNNTRNTLGRLCGLDESLIAQIMGGALLLAVALNVDEVARLSEAAFGEIEDLVREMAAA
jgi:hypothetical protein